MSIPGHILAAAAGGLVAGALVGFGEGLSIFIGDPTAGSLAPLYGSLFYGILLALAGIGVGLVSGLFAHFVKKGDPAWSPRRTWTLALLTTLIPVAIVVVRFRVIRDVFHEKLAMGSGAGIGVHVGLLLGAALLAGGLWWLLRPADKAPLARVGWAPLTAAGAAFFLLVAAPFAFLGGEESGEAVAAHNGPTLDKPPVILIMVDTLRADRLQSYGYAQETSPRMKDFAAESVQYDLAFAQASWTRPSTASLLTSLPPSAHSTMYKADRLPESVVSVAETFKDAGYDTGGLVTNYNIAPYFNFGQGFDDYRYLEPDYYWWADEGSSKLSLYNLARVVREKVAPAKDSPSYYYQDASVTTDAVLDWTENHKGRPFFLFVTYMDPHDPYFVRPLSGEAYSRAAQVNPDPAMADRLSEVYDGEIKYFDEHFGRLLEGLKKQGIYDKAVIAVTSDHGEEFQEHGGWWHGTTLYEEQIHVPLIIKHPGGDKAGKRDSSLARLMDVPPTLAALADVKPDESWRGRDLTSAPGPAAIFAEEDHQGNVLKALRGKEWKLIEANANNPRGLAPVELYRIDKDPGEAKNVAEAEPKMVKAQQAAMKDAASGAAVGAAERDQHELDEESKRLLEELGYIED